MEDHYLLSSVKEVFGLLIQSLMEELFIFTVVRFRSPSLLL